MRILLALVLLIPVLSQAGTLPLTAPQASAVNSEVTTVFGQLQTAQSQWLGATPGARYLQAKTPPGACALRGGLSLVPFEASSLVLPADRAATATRLGTVWGGQSRRAHYWIDEYKGPAGQGFLINACVTIGGVMYVRTSHTGPELYVIDNSPTGWVPRLPEP